MSKTQDDTTLIVDRVLHYSMSRRKFGSRAGCALLTSAFSAKAGRWLPGRETVYVDPVNITYLMADLCCRSNSLHVKTDASRGWVKRFWVENWRTPSQVFRWPIEVESAGHYDVTILVSAPPGSEFEVSGPNNSLRFETPATHPNYDGYNWNRIPLPSPLALSRGSGWIEVRMLKGAVTGKVAAALKSLELVNLEALS
ncbi:MAG: hypothetical protein JRN15_15810 [Nitrososphaerota archaeon]|nr:hypothetical protein [Nitrososphaerota archaeon]